MKSALLTASLAAALGAMPAAGQQDPAGQARAPQAPARAPAPQGQVIGLTLLEDLVAIGHTDLAGIFGFVPEQASAFAMADFLMRDHKSLKRFVKKCEGDFKKAHGVSLWDKQVLLHLVTINASGADAMGMRKVPAPWMDRINTLCLVEGLPLEIVVQRRGSK